MPRKQTKAANDHEALRALYAERADAIRRRLDDFRAVRHDAYLFELIYCLLTPQSSARNAQKVVDALQHTGFAGQPFDPEPILRDRKHYIRFHRTKSKHLLRVRDQMTEITTALAAHSDPRESREWLVRNVKGLGYKESTHFLRNIGRSGDLAILDRHMLRNMKRYGAVRQLPDTLSRRHYLRLERAFQRFAQSIGIPPGELDLLFWSMETGEILK